MKTERNSLLTERRLLKSTFSKYCEICLNLSNFRRRSKAYGNAVKTLKSLRKMRHKIRLWGIEPKRRIIKWNTDLDPLSCKSHISFQISGIWVLKKSLMKKSKIIKISLKISKRSQKLVGKPSMPKKKKMVKKLYVWMRRIILDHTRESELSSCFSLIRRLISPAFSYFSL